jgi:tRNA pseudouridine32 synthase/23S rRNA pseudouridine746 synthase
MSAAGVPPIVFENRDLVVIDKPSGLLSVPGRGEDKQDCALTRIQTIVPSALVVHRLDMATSGLLVFAKGARMQRALSQAFQNRETTKYYRAAVIGQPALTSNDWQTIEAPLIVDWPNRPKSKVCFETGKASTTNWRVSASPLAPQGSLADWRPDTECPMTAVDLHPITGRSHQLRVHLASVGFPIAGDALYGPCCCTPPNWHSPARERGSDSNGIAPPPFDVAWQTPLSGSQQLTAPY